MRDLDPRCEELGFNEIAWPMCTGRGVVWVIKHARQRAGRENMGGGCGERASISGQTFPCLGACHILSITMTLEDYHTREKWHLFLL